MKEWINEGVKKWISEAKNEWLTGYTDNNNNKKHTDTHNRNRQTNRQTSIQCVHICAPIVRQPFEAMFAWCQGLDRRQLPTPTPTHESVLTSPPRRIEEAPWAGPGESTMSRREHGGQERARWAGESTVGRREHVGQRRARWAEESAVSRRKHGGFCVWVRMARELQSKYLIIEPTLAYS